DLPCHGKDERRVSITAEDQEHLGSKKTIVLTQVGLKFKDNILRVEEIKRAHDVMEAHIATQQQINAEGIEKGGAPAPKADPTTVSYAGIGRSAVLIAYREALPQLESVQDENALN